MKTTSGKPLAAEQIVFRAINFSGKPIDFQGMQITTSLKNKLNNNTNLYNITFVADHNEYNKYITSIENLISSIKILDYQPINKNVSDYISSDYGFKLEYPTDWRYEAYENGFVTFQPNETLPQITNNRSDANSFSHPKLEAMIFPSENEPISEIVKADMELLTQQLSDLKLIDSKVKEEDEYPIHQILYTSENFKTLTSYIHNTKNSNVYVISYTAVMDEFYNFLPLIEQMISSVDFIPNSKVRTYTGFKTGDSPRGIAINSQTNTIYVANQLSNIISVINGSNDQILANIRVGDEPLVVGTNPIKNILYVTHPGSLSVIDGKNNTLISRILTNAESPISMAINPITNRIYIADDISKNITVVDSRKNAVVRTISTVDPGIYGSESISGIGVSADHLRNRIYVVNNLDGNITVIDGKDNSIVNKIPIVIDSSSGINELFMPTRYFNSSEISVNPFTKKAYIAGKDLYRSFIFDVDLSTEKVHELAGSGLAYNVIALNPFTNVVYVTDTDLDKVLAIDPIELNKTEIAVDSYPTFISANPNTNIVYVANSGSDTISKINGSTNDPLYGVRFKINPPNSAFIFCSNSDNTMKLSDNDYVVYNNGTSVKCEAESRDGFSPLLSGSWSGLDSKAPIEFSVTKYGMLSGSFLDFTTLMQRLGPFISLIVLIAVILAASFPSLLGKLRKISDLVIEEKLTRTEIVGIDASIIVGVLFFLTISEGFELSEQMQITIVTANIIFPFAISAILAIIKHDKAYATRLMIAGFINLIISVILISMMRI